MTLILQDIILNGCRRDKLKVKICDIKGITYTGTIRGFDNFTIIIDCGGDQVMFYKDNIISITPEKPILIDDYDKKKE